MIIRFISASVLTLLLLSGCSIYRMDIQQGNYITEAELSQLRVGMSRGQVQELLGTPLLADDFRQNRWDYVFYLKQGGNISKRSGVTVFFDQNGVVNDVRPVRISTPR